MGRTAEVIAVTFVARHCTEYGCRKCAARASWSRRKKRALQEIPRPPYYRKEVMR